MPNIIIFIQLISHLIPQKAHLTHIILVLYNYNSFYRIFKAPLTLQRPNITGLTELWLFFLFSLTKRVNNLHVINKIIYNIHKNKVMLFIQ